MRSPADTLWVEQLELAQVPEGEWPSVYVLGAPASRITLADQQKRAFNLVASLVASGRASAGRSLAVIGGGVGGITTAAYAVQFGLKPTVFEQFADVMALQQGSNRWIHPNLYDWPWPGWSTKHTAFPCMNWKADSVVRVIADLRKEWTHLARAADIAFVPNGLVTDLSWDGARWRIEKHSDGFDAVVLAVGFGEDVPRKPFDGSPYWRDDDLHQRARSASHVLVSGCGDGGLIDALRAIMLDFRHDDLIQICNQPDLDAVCGSILDIETNRAKYPDGRALTEAFTELDVPPDVDSCLERLLKPGVRVTLNGAADGAFARSSSPLNRFLVSRLMRLGRVVYLPGTLDTVTPTPVGGRQVVHISSIAHDEFDLVVVRHGPNPAAISRFHKIAAALASARVFFRTYRDVVDRSRQPLWNDILRQTQTSAAAAGVDATAVDDRLREYLSEQTYALFKVRAAELVEGLIVKRVDHQHVTELQASAAGVPLGTVQLNFISDTKILIVTQVANHSPAPPPAIAAGDSPEQLLEAVQRIVRNSSFLIAGAR